MIDGFGNNESLELSDTYMPKIKPKKTVLKTDPAYEILLLTAFFLSGATSLALEVAWSKELSYLRC